MAADVRMRASLIWRMVVALGVLTVVSVCIAITAIVVGGFLAWFVFLALAGVLNVLLLPFLQYQNLDPNLIARPVLRNPLRIAVGSGLCLLPFLYYRPVRDEIREFRTELGEAGDTATETYPAVVEMVRRLAQQADIPAPDVYVVDRRRPESYALGGRSSGTIIVTTGLVRQLSDSELNAVLAHEISHLVNGDSRIMNLVLVPMLVAEHIGSDEPPTKRQAYRQVPEVNSLLAHLVLWVVLTAITKIQQLCCQFGIAILSRGREFAADRGAAKLTGSPGDLASALETLDDGRKRPAEDKRNWAKAASALDILPLEESIASRGPFRTHPSTEARIERLQALAEEMVTDDQ